MSHAHQHTHSIEYHIERLKHNGYKLTNARMVVLNVLQALGGHVTSAQILEAVSATDSSIGRASVFRTLELLARLGMVRPTYLENSLTPHYVLLPDGHHHHIICTRCNRVIEIESCGLEALTRQLEETLNVKLSGHLLEFYGECADCQSTQPIEEE
jgi:Fur family transcriptional regulator, ferric uptake regulator